MLSAHERERYARQLLLFGDAGQEKLQAARVVVAGAGGLGSPVSLCLAAAGIGTIRIIDCDVVERSNLNRQILHAEADIGRDKVLSAADTLSALNPGIRVEPVRAEISGGNVASLVAGFDVIVDALDTIGARQHLNRAALRNGVPLVHGAVRGFFGQVTTVVPGKTGCLGCLLPREAEREVCPVIGTTPAVIGAIQAAEVVRFLIGEGELLTDRLLLYEGIRAEFSEITLRRNPACPACGCPAVHCSGGKTC